MLWLLLLGFGGEPSAPYDALGRLKEGNARFLAGRPMHPNSDLNRVRETGSRGQRPFAALLTCADSRLAPERLFDQGLGDLFVVRVAGNVCATNEMASLEYAAGHLDVPLVFVLGHTQCGAVAAAVANGEAHGSMAGLLEHLKPAVQQARGLKPGGQAREVAAAAVSLNVYRSMEAMLRRSAPLRERIESGRTALFGAVYDVATGGIEWLGAHPDQDRLLRMELAAVHASGHASQGAGHGAPADHGPGLWVKAALALLLLASGTLLGVGLSQRRAASKAA